MFTGSIPALVTPFRDEAFDEDAYRRFVAWQIAEGSHGLVPCGTTGEGATLDSAEHRRVVEICVEAAAGRVPVIAGCGSNDTAPGDRADPRRQGGRRRRRAARAALLQPPQPGGHLRPSRRDRRGGRHPDRPLQRAVADDHRHRGRDDGAARARSPTSSRSRTRPAISPASPPSASPAARISSSCPAMTTWPWASTRWAASGCISVTANVAPRLCADFQNRLPVRRLERRRSILQDLLYPLHAALFTDASPGPVKYALNRVRPDFPADLRLPMTPASRSEPPRGRRRARPCRARLTPRPRSATCSALRAAAMPRPTGSPRAPPAGVRRRAGARRACPRLSRPCRLGRRDPCRAARRHPAGHLRRHRRQDSGGTAAPARHRRHVRRPLRARPPVGAAAERRGSGAGALRALFRPRLRRLPARRGDAHGCATSAGCRGGAARRCR